MAKYKLVFTIPVANAEAARKAIGESGAGRLGNYSFCSFSSKGIGRFRPEQGASPSIGEIGKMEEVEEERIECQLDAEVVDDVLAALKKAHPYEEIAYDLYPLELVEMRAKQYIDTVACICLRGGKILSTLSKGKDMYYIPGGKRRSGEADEQVLMREAKEELLVDLIPGTIKYYGTFSEQAHGKPAGITVRAKCYTADFKGEPRPGSEKEKVIWLGYEDKDKSSPLDRLIFDDLKTKGLIN